MKESTFRVEIVEDLLISFCTAGPISDHAWNGFLDHARMPRIQRYIGGAIGQVQATSLQRKSIADVFKTRKIPAVAITNSSLVRGIVTAIAWLGVGEIKAFDWPELREGLHFLKVTGSHQDRAVVVMERLRDTTKA